MPRALHDGAAGRRVTTHEQGYAQDAFVANDGDLGRCAILHHIQQRNDARCGKIDVPQLGSGLIQNVTEVHRYQFQMGSDPPKVTGR